MEASPSCGNLWWKKEQGKRGDGLMEVELVYGKDEDEERCELFPGEEH